MNLSNRSANGQGVIAFKNKKSEFSETQFVIGYCRKLFTPPHGHFDFEHLAKNLASCFRKPFLPLRGELIKDDNAPKPKVPFQAKSHRRLYAL
jgi:hypothetical protein